MPQRKFFHLRSGLRIAALDWGGNKPLAILCHANGFCASTWSLVAERLQQDLRVIALDARGHGASSVPKNESLYDWKFLVEDLLQVTEQLLEEETAPQVALLAGNSLGAVIGATAAAWEPARFRSMVMLDPPVLPVGEMGAHSEKAVGMVEQTRRRKRLFDSRQAVESAYRGKQTFADWHEEAFEHYLNDGFASLTDGRLALRCPPEVEAAIFEKTGSIDLFAEARKVQAEVTLVHAARGRFDCALYQRLNERFPSGTLISIEGGHLLPMEMPEETAGLLSSVVGAALSGRRSD